MTHFVHTLTLKKFKYGLISVLNNLCLVVTNWVQCTYFL